LLQLDTASLSEVLQPKVKGGWLLHQLLADAPLDFFVLFSSAATLLPAPGQASYAAAHIFLDALAHYRRAQGLPALCINLGAWADSGTMVTPGGRRLLKYLETRGVGSITHKQGLAVLEQLLQQSSPQVVVVSVNWSQFCQADPAAADSPLLAPLARQESKPWETGGPRGRLTRD